MDKLRLYVEQVTNELDNKSVDLIKLDYLVQNLSLIEQNAHRFTNLKVAIDELNYIAEQQHNYLNDLNLVNHIQADITQLQKIYEQKQATDNAYKQLVEFIHQLPTPADKAIETIEQTVTDISAITHDEEGQTSDQKKAIPIWHTVKQWLSSLWRQWLGLIKIEHVNAAHLSYLNQEAYQWLKQRLLSLSQLAYMQLLYKEFDLFDHSITTIKQQLDHHYRTDHKPDQQPNPHQLIMAQLNKLESFRQKQQTPVSLFSLTRVQELAKNFALNQGM